MRLLLCSPRASLTWNGLLWLVLTARTHAFSSFQPGSRALPTTSGVTLSSAYQVSIEYCTGCRWNLRSFWLAQELLQTFDDDDALECVTLIPSRRKPGGDFYVRCIDKDGTEAILWDRRKEEGFPEAKELKQRVRDHIDPGRYLGHSDVPGRSEPETEETVASTEAEEPMEPALPTLLHAPSPSVTIGYCTGCRWLLRAAWMGQELLSTFSDELNAVALVPLRPPVKGGSFLVACGDRVMWNRAIDGGFPPITDLKQRVRDQLDPDKDLGHSEKKPDAPEMDDDEAQEARRFFGVF